MTTKVHKTLSTPELEEMPVHDFGTTDQVIYSLRSAEAVSKLKSIGFTFHFFGNVVANVLTRTI